MSCFRAASVLVCSLSLVSIPLPDQQASASAISASAILQQAVSAMGHIPSDSSASGSVSIVAGSDPQTGSIQIQTRGTDQSLEQLTTPSGTTQAIFSRGNFATANNSNPKTLSSLEFAASSQSALFPLPLLAGILASSDSAYQYVGAETLNGASCQHIRTWNTYVSQLPLQYLASFTARDIWIDSATNLPVRLSYSLRAGTGADPAMSVEILYSGYKSVNGVQFPFHISKSLNGTPWADIAISSVSLNTGLTDSTFSLQ